MRLLVRSPADRRAGGAVAFVGRPWSHGHMALLFVVVGVIVIAAAFWLATGRLVAQLPDASHDLKPAERGGEPAFDVVARGYRMDEVDATIADLQARIRTLQAEK